MGKIGCKEARQRARQHIVDMGNWVQSRNIEALASHCAMPFIAYIQDEILVIDTWEDMKDLYGSHIDRLDADGPYKARIEFLSHEVQAKERHCVVVRWRLNYQDIEKNKDLSTRYMLRVDNKSDDVVLELLEDVTGHTTEFSELAKEHYARLLELRGRRV